MSDGSRKHRTPVSKDQEKDPLKTFIDVARILACIKWIVVVGVTGSGLIQVACSCFQ